MKSIIFAASLAVLATPALAAPADLPWSDLIVFGDSLSDAGNFGPGFVATNGTTWAGQLGALPALAGGSNFAFLGATAVSNGGSPDFTEQRALFAGSGLTLGANPLVVAWFGGNDLLNAADASAIVNAVTQIAAGVTSLATDFGLTRFVLPGLPDLGLIPRNVGNPIASATATFAANAFNAALLGFVGTANAAGLDVTYLDTNAVFGEILANPIDFGFTDVTGSCLGGTISCDGFLFWDDIHPTAATHAILAERFLMAVEPPAVPLPATGLLLLGAFAGLGLLRRRAA